jgi:hypothetical protein
LRNAPFISSVRKTKTTFASRVFLVNIHYYTMYYKRSAIKKVTKNIIK